MMSIFLKKLLAASCLFLALASLAMAQGSGMTRGYMMGPRTSLPTMPGYQGHELSESVVVPQFVVGDQCTTSMLIFNMGSMTQMRWMPSQAFQLTGNIYFYRQDGSPLQVSVNGSSPVSDYPFTLSASDLIALEISASGTVTSGWALIAVDDTGSYSWGRMNGQQMMRSNRIMANAYYTYNENGQAVSRAGVIPSIYAMQQYATSLTPVEVRDGIDTGLAIVNTSSQSATIQLTLKNSNGETIANRQLTLPAGNQVARFVDEAQLFGSAITGDFSGFLQMDTSDNGVVVLGLFMTGGVVTSSPLQHHRPVSRF